MSAAEIAAVKEGQADFAAGRFMSEAQFRRRMSQYIKSREAKIAKKRTAR